METILIDGHNALFALRLLTGDHERDRHALLRRVRDRMPNATVYFDGRGSPRNLPTVHRQEGVKVTYCGQTEADTEILEDVRHAVNPRRLLVVTNDRELFGKCSQLGARIARVEDVLGDDDEDEAPIDVRPGRRPRVPDPDYVPAPGDPLDRVETALTPADFDLPEVVDLDNPKGL